MGRKKGFKHSQETRDMISLKLRGKPQLWSIGDLNPMKKLENRQKISKALKGIIRSEETRKRISKAGIGRANPNKGKDYIETYGTEKAREIKEKIKKARSKQGGLLEPHLGKQHTAEARQKIRLARAKMVYPHKDTSIELKIQNFLKELNIEFIPHYFVRDIEHLYSCDVYVPSLNLIIECDGIYWHKFPVGKEIDEQRNKELIEKGYKVIRLWENEINGMSLDTFKELISQVGEWRGNMEFFGLRKAKIVLEHIEDIKRFVEENEG